MFTTSHRHVYPLFGCVKWAIMIFASDRVFLFVLCCELWCRVFYMSNIIRIKANLMLINQVMSIRLASILIIFDVLNMFKTTFKDIKLFYMFF